MELGKLKFPQPLYTKCLSLLASFPVLVDQTRPAVPQFEGGEDVCGDGAHDEEQVEEGERQQHVVEGVLAHLLAAVAVASL